MQFAAMLGVGRKTIINIENGRTRLALMRGFIYAERIYH